MTSTDSGAFGHLPRTADGHFVLCLYATIYRIVQHVAALDGPEPDGAVLQEYPFLGEYFAEMRRFLPADLTWEQGADWWEAEVVAWERGCDRPLPLMALAAAGGWSFTTRLAFVAVGLVEEDSRFGTLFSRLQLPLAHRRPTQELIGRIVANGIEPWSVSQPLLQSAVVVAENAEAPRSEWVLRPAPGLWDCLRLPDRLEGADGCTHAPCNELATLESLVLPAAFRDQLARLACVLTDEQVGIVVLRGAPGADAPAVAEAVARSLGRGVLRVSTDLGQAEWPRLGPIATALHALPVFGFDLAPGETRKMPALPGYDGPVAVLLGATGGIDAAEARSITLELPALDRGLRAECWRAALPQLEPRAIEGLADSFLLQGEHLRSIARSAALRARLAGRDAVGLGDARAAARELGSDELHTLATRLDEPDGWSDLVASAATQDGLAELERRCRLREPLATRLGARFGGGFGIGVRALMTGASGTGKTLAARILAAEIGKDLYRVDLASIVDKYIGETEKNLHRIFTRAEALDVVLLLDEGDSLLGRRTTDVRSANDRYANLETNFLLQRLETYSGIVLVTTNLGENIDTAFLRRMDVVIPFFLPEVAERHAILCGHLPDDHEVDARQLELVAVRCRLSGGQLRNVAVRATLNALADGAAVGEDHLDRALRTEFAKTGGTYPFDAEPDVQSSDGGMQAFVAAFGR